ncbi:MAG: co-chaperone GroES [Anaerolineales bacterium]|nr:co-chaperone GroES [Anaerolineales bacterium]
MNLKPLGDRLVVEPKEKENTTASGLVLPDTASEKPQQGTVLAVGPGSRDEDGDRIAMDVQEGNQVLFAKYAGTEIKIDGKKYLILKESDVLAIVVE